MKKSAIESVKELSKLQAEHVKKLQEIVEDAIREEELIVTRLENSAEETLSKGEMFSDKVAEFGGSWKFIILFTVIFIVWICINVFAGKYWRFDPYPFILMNLVLSCIAALQAPVILMSQNRKEEKDRKRAENDYLVNLKAEIEIRNLHRKINLLIEEQITKLLETQSLEIKMLNELHKRIPPTKDPGKS
jgi:uncharacterized membrane protein